jgi:hypothetical protein
MIWCNQVTTEVSDSFYWVDLVANFDFEGLHGLLDGLSNLVEAGIDACESETCVSCFFH